MCVPNRTLVFIGFLFGSCVAPSRPPLAERDVCNIGERGTLCYTEWGCSNTPSCSVLCDVFPGHIR